MITVKIKGKLVENCTIIQYVDSITFNKNYDIQYIKNLPFFDNLKKIRFRGCCSQNFLENNPRYFK